MLPLPVVAVRLVDFNPPSQLLVENCTNIGSLNSKPLTRKAVSYLITLDQSIYIIGQKKFRAYFFRIKFSSPTNNYVKRRKVFFWLFFFCLFLSQVSLISSVELKMKILILFWKKKVLSLLSNIV